MNYNVIIKRLREENKLSQSEISDILKIDRITYTNYEINNYTMPLKYLVVLADYYKISLDYVFTLNDIKQYDNFRNGIDVELSAKRLKEFRKEKKLTQVKLGDFLNASPSVVVHHENKRHIIATSYLYMICKKYNISADYLLGKVDSPKYLTK